MSFNLNQTVFRKVAPIPNGFPPQMNNKPKSKAIFMDVTPARTPDIKMHISNHIVPLKDNLINQINKDIVYENIKPVFSILRLMGAIPLTKLSNGVNQFQLTSPAMLYSAVVFFSLICSIVYVSFDKAPSRTNEVKFEEVVIEYLFTIYLFPLTTVPILWYETSKIVSLLNGWVDFEIVYKQLSGRILPVKLYKKALALAIVIPIVSTTSVIVTHVTIAHFKFVKIIPYIFLEVLTYILGGYWYLLCEMLIDCSNILADDFQLALRHMAPSGQVTTYRALWLRLSKLARNTGVAHSYSFIVICLYLFLIITLSIYGLFSQITGGFAIKDIGLALTAFCSVLLLFFICDVAHHASFEVQTNFQKKLLLAELTWMSTDAQTEVKMFLRATEMNPSHVTLGGFFDVNRNLFKSLLATMVTYLVVLLQFQISIPDDSEQAEVEEPVANETISTTAATTTVATTMLTTLAKKMKKRKN